MSERDKEIKKEIRWPYGREVFWREREKRERGRKEREIEGKEKVCGGYFDWGCVFQRERERERGREKNKDSEKEILLVEEIFIFERERKRQDEYVCGKVREYVCVHVWWRGACKREYACERGGDREKRDRDIYVVEGNKGEREREREREIQSVCEREREREKEKTSVCVRDREW